MSIFVNKDQFVEGVYAETVCPTGKAKQLKEACLTSEQAMQLPAPWTNKRSRTVRVCDVCSVQKGYEWCSSPILNHERLANANKVNHLCWTEGGLGMGANGPLAPTEDKVQDATAALVRGMVMLRTAVLAVKAVKAKRMPNPPRGTKATVTKLKLACLACDGTNANDVAEMNSKVEGWQRDHMGQSNEQDTFYKYTGGFCKFLNNADLHLCNDKH